MISLFTSRALPASAPLAGRSYWQRHGGAPEASPGGNDAGNPARYRDPLPRRSDVVIIGGGLAGLSTAVHLAEAEPAISIVLLEADFVGFGASGRNAGLLSPLPAPVWLVTASTDPEHAWALGHINARVHSLAGWLEAHVPASEIEPQTLRLASLGRVTATGLGRVARTLAAVGIAHVTGSGPEKHLTVDLATHAIHPYRTVRALADLAVHRGVSIHEHAPVLAIEETQNGVRVVLDEGRALDAKTVVVCTNAYTPSLALPVKARAKVVYNFMVATDVLAPECLQLLPHDDSFVVELNTAYVFYRLHRGRLVYGGIERFKLQGQDDFAVPPDVLAGMERLLARSFPGTGMAPAEAWGGCYHQTTTDLPLIARTGSRGAIVLNVGYGGTGVALTMICGRLAAALALGGCFADADDHRLFDALTRTRVPVAGVARFVAGVAVDLIRGHGGRQLGRTT